MDLPRVDRLTPYFERLEDGKTYRWCACGLSKTQPFCDDSHVGTGIEPVEFTRRTVKNVALCACKKTKRPPYCDGEHRALMAEDELEREERFPRGLPVHDEHSRDVVLGAAVPDLPVADCPAAIRYYCDVLGFEKVYDDAELGFERTLYACVRRGALTLTLDWHRSDEIAQKVHLVATVDDVDALYEELRARGANIDDEIKDHPWGERTFGIVDLDGHSLAFTMKVEPDSGESAG
jgi:uncharacterized glyoxalase superfamily protein PhnB/CDGSH-type Zn-finger protein